MVSHDSNLSLDSRGHAYNPMVSIIGRYRQRALWECQGGRGALGYKEGFEVSWTWGGGSKTALPLIKLEGPEVQLFSMAKEANDGFRGRS